MEIRSLEHIGFDTLFQGFENAFSDYEIDFDKEEVRSMLERRGYKPCLSFAAFADGEIVAFTLNGIGQFNGIPTAYDTGTGTVKDFRGQGLAGKIFSYSLPFLKEAGIRQYLLEVLQNNHKAINVYRKMGFKTTREFDCFRQNIAEIRNPGPIRPDTAIRIETIDADVVEEATTFCDFIPSWQNSFESIERGRPGLTCIGAFHSNGLVGYCVIDRTTGDLTRIAVDRNFRRRGIASHMLKKAMSMMETDFIKILNIPTDDSTLHGFLNDRNIPLINRQYEMILTVLA
ncbi:MAG: GNAT family N-acetyltransferase [Muribaculaceae bacterium]|nr:GNAT family N-acetyltransferase [Muribaculaceae bacterium]